MRFFKRTPKEPKHDCDFLWDEPYMENYTKKVWSDDDCLYFDARPKIVKFKALAQRGTCPNCGKVTIRKV